MGTYTTIQGTTAKEQHTVDVLMLVRDFAVPLVSLLIVLCINQRYVVLATIVGGQAHFLMAYIYQYRGRRMNRLYVGVALLLLCLGVCVYAYVPFAFRLMYFFVAVVFGTHFALDEITLHDETWTFEKIVSGIGFVLLFITAHIYMMFPSFAWLPLMVSLFFLSGMFIRLIRHAWPTKAERYLWYLALLFMAVMVYPHGIMPYMLSMFIVMLHFVNWLVGYGIKVHRTAYEKRYWIETAFTTLLSAVLGVWYSLTMMPVLGYFFSLAYYYFWSSTHVILSYVSSWSRKS